MNKDDVLRVAGEPVAYLCDWDGYFAVFIKKPEKVNAYRSIGNLYTEAKLLAVAEAMIAVGAEDMRERAKAACSNRAKGLLSIIDLPVCQSAIIQRDRANQWTEAEMLVNSLPITTNTEGERRLSAALAAANERIRELEATESTLMQQLKDYHAISVKEMKAEREVSDKLATAARLVLMRAKEQSGPFKQLVDGGSLQEALNAYDALPTTTNTEGDQG